MSVDSFFISSAVFVLICFLFLQLSVQFHIVTPLPGLCYAHDLFEFDDAGMMKSDDSLTGSHSLTHFHKDVRVAKDKELQSVLCKQMALCVLQCHHVAARVKE